MVLISLSSGLNISHASEEQPSMELLELLGQFEQQDEAWVNNELGIENNLDVEIKSDLQKPDKQSRSEFINE